MEPRLNRGSFSLSVSLDQHFRLEEISSLRETLPFLRGKQVPKQRGSRHCSFDSLLDCYFYVDVLTMYEDFKKYPCIQGQPYLNAFQSVGHEELIKRSLLSQNSFSHSRLRKIRAPFCLNWSPITRERERESGAAYLRRYSLKLRSLGSR